MGVFPAIPYAIWFYLAIEGVANVAEEAKNPQRDLVVGFGSAMATLVVLAFLVLFASVGVSGWETVVYPAGSTQTSDSPLPLAIAKVVGESHVFYHLLVAIGLFGLVASFHGIILVAGRATLEFGRVGYAPRFLGRTLPERKTPAAALILNTAIGILALLSGRTSEIITISVFGALTLYVVSMLAFFRLRKKEPARARPFRTPFYPIVPGIALVLALLCLMALAYYNPRLALIYLGIVVGGFTWFYIVVPKTVRDQSVLEVAL
jgi:ethanolamine permease